MVMPALPEQENAGRHLPTLTDILQQARQAGYPEQALEELRSRAEFLRRVSDIAKIDVDAEVEAAFRRLPEFRQQRAAEESKIAASLTDPAERKSRQEHARWLERQAATLARPDADGQLRARALATELSVRLAAKLRGIELSTPDVDPSSLRLFERTFEKHTRGLESEGLEREEARHQARLAFLQALVEADVSPDDSTGLHAAIVQYRKITTRSVGAEPGHLHDQSLEESGNHHRTEQPTETDPMVVLESQEESVPEQNIAAIAQTLDRTAAAALRPRQYAIFQVLAGNTQLFDWRLDPDGKLRFQKRKGADKGANIAAVVMDEVGGFSGRGAAYRAVHDTLDRLGEALRQMGRDALLEELPGAKVPAIPDPEQIREDDRQASRQTAQRKQGREETEIE